MIDLTARDQRLFRRLAEAGEGTGPALAPEERARVTALRDGISHALLLEAGRRAEAVADLSPPPALPAHRDWTWRPPLWSAPSIPCGWAATEAQTALSPEVGLFHDCPLGEIAARQVRAAAPPFALAIEVYGFEGTYLSLAITLPVAALANLRLRHVLRLDTCIRSERPARVYARLNVQRGGAPATMVREMLLAPDGTSFVDFDLAALRIDPARVTGLWIDLILDSSAANGIVIGDLVLSRTPRAEF